MEAQSAESTAIVSVKSELVALAVRRGGLTPIGVLDAARNPASPLHTHFEWEDSEAAEKYRLLQAAVLIRQVRVTVLAPDGEKTATVRAFVSLPSDRLSHTGYRSIEAVLSSQPQRAELLAMAHAELVTFQRKYQVLSELADVFESIDRVLGSVASG
jgi:predicted TIM-barrel enzyme